MALNLIMIGPPGCGKGTQADRVAAARGIPKISTGDMLRGAVRAKTELGLRAKAVMDRGELVSDEIMVGIVRERLQQPDAGNGFILDGFPRTVAQARSLDQILEGREPLVVIELAVPDEEVLRRLSSRRVCGACGANAEPGADSSTDQDVCRKCGGRMVTRSDDGDASVRERRLQVYAREAQPLLDYYRSRPSYRLVNGAQSLDRVGAELAAAIGAAQAGGRPAPGSPDRMEPRR
jgi:adenylate kinase